MQNPMLGMRKAVIARKVVIFAAPMVVLSNDGYNQAMGMIIGMPITSKVKHDHRIYVPVDDHASGISGSIITFQLPNYDFDARHGEIVGHVSASMLNELISRAKTIF